MKGRSLFIWSTDSAFRRWVYNLTSDTRFDYFILLTIVLSSIQLALENPLNDPEGELMSALFYVDIFTTTIFVTEATLKIIAYGLIINYEDSYLKNAWNLIDFIIVIFSVISLSIRNSPLKVFKVFRLLRVLRPIRLIARNEGLRVAI